MKPYGQTIQIYLPTRDATGLRIAGIPTRTVQVFDIPRSSLGEFLEREESSRPAVYHLFGSTDMGDPGVYIGQSNNVGDRLRTHDRDRIGWERALVAISLTNEWSQTHIGYLEWESIRLARDAGRYTVENSNAGTQPHTPDPLKADCVEYLATIRQLLSTLGFPVMERPKSAVSGFVDGHGDEVSESRGTGVEVTLRGRGAIARGVYSSEGLLVLEGSVGRRLPGATAPHQAGWVVKIDALAESGVVEVSEDGKSYTFIKDHLFGSPSAAASILSCNNRNGRGDFKDRSGSSIAQIDEIRADRAVEKRDSQ